MISVVWETILLRVVTNVQHRFGDINDDVACSNKAYESLNGSVVLDHSLLRFSAETFLSFMLNYKFISRLSRWNKEYMKSVGRAFAIIIIIIIIIIRGFHEVGSSLLALFPYLHNFFTQRLFLPSMLSFNLYMPSALHTSNISLSLNLNVHTRRQNYLRLILMLL
jgi:hypothetical protein